jgi:hypothetical protein
MPKFSVGDILLCFSGPLDDNAAGILPLVVVDRVGSRFYSLAGVGYKSREAFGKLESRAFRLPPSFPWSFPEEFRAFRYLFPIAYCSRVVTVYEAGIPYARKFEGVVSEFTGEAHKRIAEFGFRVRGYVIREAKSGSEERWFWLNERWDVLVKLKELMVEAERSPANSEDDLPEHLQEQGRSKWEASPIPPREATSTPGNILCEGSVRSGFSFSTFDGFTRSGKLKTIQFRPPGEARPVSLPSAFPRPILARLESISRFRIFDETILWVAHERWRSSTATDSVQRPTDLPGGAMTIGALTDLLRGETAIYYSNDLVRWWRRLSKALECELDRLRFIYPTGVPAVQ